VRNEHKLTTLDNGVRIVTEAMPSVRSVSVGFWIGTGSRAETDEQAGLSHLLEHLLFKGSSKYRSLEIDQIFDGMGAEINAGTGKETTSLYARVLDEHLERAFDVMADMVFAPTLEDIDAERQVILEEIAMYEDDPQEKVFDVLGEAVFAGHPLGRAIIGRAAVVAGTPTDTIAAFHGARYVPRNVVISAAGAVDHEAFVELAATRAARATGSNGDSEATFSFAEPPAPATTVAARRFEQKDTEQYHVCIGGPGISRHDDRRFALRVLDTIFGGTSSSRLFQEVRQDSGQIGLYVGTRADNLAQAMGVVGDELERVRREPATPDELDRAKENLKGRVVLALESTGSRMSRLGSETLAGAPLLSIDDVIGRIDGVSQDDLAELSESLWATESLSAAGIGPDAIGFDQAISAIGITERVAERQA